MCLVTVPCVIESFRMTRIYCIAEVEESELLGDKNPDQVPAPPLGRQSPVVAVYFPEAL